VSRPFVRPEADAVNSRGGLTLPTTLALLSTALAAAVAYGTHPWWAQHRYGLEVILLSRRLQWPLIVGSLFAAVALVGLIGAGKQRAWWLISLAPIFALFLHAFATDPTSGMSAVENPTFVPAAAAGNIVADDDFVVGLTFEGKDYAYPYAALYWTPAVIHAQHDKRLLLMWSAPANRAVAMTVKRDVKGRNLDVVSTPANALLLYDASKGAFVNGLTGLTVRGAKPAGFVAPVPTWKMPWGQWRTAHPETLVMTPVAPRGFWLRSRRLAQPPRQPLWPSCPMPGKNRQAAGQTSDQRVVVVGTQKPVAVASGGLGVSPVNASADGTPVMAFRDPQTNVARAFSRRVVDDLAPTFALHRGPRRKADAMFIDADTNSSWNTSGVAVDGTKDYRGRRLSPVPAEDDLYWGVMKYWYPDLQLVEAAPQSEDAVQTAGAVKTNTASVVRPARSAPQRASGRRASPRPAS
jgi:hypothetical protein